MTARTKSAETCAYCGNPSSGMTRDHVVPKALWVGQRPQGMVTVPACPLCHADLDSDAEYFRNALILLAESEHHPMVKVVEEGPFARAIKRKSDSIRPFLVNQRPSLKQSTSGLITEIGFTVPFDFAKFAGFIRKIVRGLFFHMHKSRLSERYSVGVWSDSSFWDDANFQSILEKMPPYVTYGDSVFQCRYTRDISDLNRTAWLLLFYRSVGVFAWTTPS